MIENLFWISGGAVLGVLAAVLLMRLGGEWRWRGLLTSLTVMTVAYVAFGVDYGDIRAVALEAISGTAIIALALVFWRRRAVLLPGLVLAHAGLDAAHVLASSPIVPDWYAWGCLGFDGALGLTAMLLFRSPEARHA